MLVNIDVEAFQEPVNLPILIDFVRSFTEGRHEWDADLTVISAVETYFRQHAPSLAVSCVELAKKSTVALAWSGNGGHAPVAVRVGATELHELAEDLRRPAVLVAENNQSDEYFIKALCKAFGANRVATALDNGWMEIANGGGSTLSEVAQRTAARFHKCIRVVALLDSDRMVPGQGTQSHAKANSLSQLGIVVHVLELREAENYVPNRVLACIGRPRQASKKLDLLKRLTSDQRGHFDMKKGFGPVTDKAVVPAQQIDLYSDVAQEVIDGLRGGFGNSILKRMYELSDRLTEEDFAGIGSGIVDELRDLLAKLSNAI